MCTGLLAICICNHYQVLYWTTRCDLKCRFPRNRLQRVDFQCTECDALNQKILELQITAQTRVRDTARETNKYGAWAQKRSWMNHTEAEKQALRRILVAEHVAKEKEIARELDMAVQKVKEEWLMRVDEMWVNPEEMRFELEEQSEN